MKQSRSPKHTSTTSQTPPSRNRRAQRFVVVAMLAISLTLLVWGGAGLWQWYRATHNPNPLPDGSLAVTHSTGNPDETPIDTESDYQVAPDQPRTILSYRPSTLADSALTKTAPLPCRATCT